MDSKDVLLLSEHLKGAGFHTAAITANYVVNDQFGFKQGWDLFENHSRDDRGNGKEIYARAADWLENRPDGRFFLWVQSVDPHTPYDVPREYSEPLPPRLLPRAIWQLLRVG